MMPSKEALGELAKIIHSAFLCGDDEEVTIQTAGDGMVMICADGQQTPPMTPSDIVSSTRNRSRNSIMVEAIMNGGSVPNTGVVKMHSDTIDACDAWEARWLRDE